MSARGASNPGASRKAPPDPRKDKLAYFKDNIQTPHDDEDFDPKIYYYHRQDKDVPIAH